MREYRLQKYEKFNYRKVNKVKNEKLKMKNGGLKLAMQIL